MSLKEEVSILPMQAFCSGRDAGTRNNVRTAISAMGVAAFDRLFALAALLALLPILVVIIALIGLLHGWPVFYAQERIGKNGKVFRCYKFRSMVRDADQRLASILATDAKRRAEWAATHKLSDDPRVHRIGAFLRRTSLDEIPQFWNVLKGEMSVVGPRPIVAAEVGYYGDHIGAYLSTRPGLTGLWQVSGRSSTSYEERVRLDQRYHTERSFLLDLRIIVRTLKVVVVGHGAC